MCNERYVMSVTEFEKCRPYAKIVPRKIFRNSEIPPLKIANALRIPPGGGPEGPIWKDRSDQKKFFFQKIACFGRKSRMGRFFKKEKLPKIYHTTC